MHVLISASGGGIKAVARADDAEAIFKRPLKPRLQRIGQKLPYHDVQLGDFMTVFEEAFAVFCQGVAMVWESTLWARRGWWLTDLTAELEF